MPELRTVRYLFEPPDAPRDVDPESPAGLVRWEFDWKHRLGRNAGPRSAQERQTRQPTKTRIAASSAAKDRSTSAGDPLGEHGGGWFDDRVPEVVAMEFRYFDGAAWSDQWSSLARKSLPVAVEIRIGLTSAEEPGQPSHERAKRSRGRRTMSQGPMRTSFPPDAPRARLPAYHGGDGHRVERAGPGPKPIGAWFFLSTPDGPAVWLLGFPRHGWRWSERGLLRSMDEGWAMRRSRGMVLIIVVVVIFMISLAGLSFVTMMNVEYKAVQFDGDELQLQQIAGSGTEFLKVFLDRSRREQDEAGGTWNNPGLFRGVPAYEDLQTRRRGRFSLLSPRTGEETAERARFGLDNESVRLNLAMLLGMGCRRPGAGREALMNLPGMTESIADSILDWIDVDSTPRQFGAEADYYQGLQLPYSPRNGVPQCLEELLLVRGMSRDLLFGPDGLPSRASDARPSGRAEMPPRSDGQRTTVPWASLLTVCRRGTQPRLRRRLADSRERRKSGRPVPAVGPEG